jgi:hypothetical protein
LDKYTLDQLIATTAERERLQSPSNQIQQQSVEEKQAQAPSKVVPSGPMPAIAGIPKSFFVTVTTHCFHCQHKHTDMKFKLVSSILMFW